MWVQVEAKLLQSSNIFIILAHAGWEESRDIDDCFTVESLAFIPIDDWIMERRRSYKCP